ncbi:Sterol O-acyltransferase 1 [Blomia tropicalis]|nr:Sterol O-acyltransferase 1 [Blomia tropicalis]
MAKLKTQINTIDSSPKNNNKSLKCNEKISNIDKQHGEKHFKAQDSLLTDLIDGNQQVRAVYNLILGFVGVYSLTTIGDYIIHWKRTKQDLDLALWNVRHFYPHFIIPWIVMNISIVFILYPLIYLRSICQQSKWKQILFNLGYLLNSSFMLIFCSLYIIYNETSLTISTALTLELMRLLMKCHSYFIEKSNPNGLNVQTIPKLKNLMYFLFAPTLIYRDEYPRNNYIRWRFVLIHLIQFVVTVIVLFTITMRFAIDRFHKTGLEPFQMSNTFEMLGSSFVYGFISSLFVFYMVLHVWHNLTAELLKFADRRYYDAWWESVSLTEFYRKWNILVQDWLYAYIYVPIHRSTNSRAIAAYAVIFISGIAHEYVLAFSLGFFFPLLFISFSLGGHIYYLMTRNRKRTNWYNIMFLVVNKLGLGLIIFGYTIEWYSRINCPLNSENSTIAVDVIQQIIPRTLSCVQLNYDGRVIF